VDALFVAMIDAHRNRLDPLPGELLQRFVDLPFRSRKARCCIEQVLPIVHIENRIAAVADEIGWRQVHEHRALCVQLGDRGFRLNQQMTRHCVRWIGRVGLPALNMSRHMRCILPYALDFYKKAPGVILTPGTRSG
jgi:hypothetical protein